MKQEIKQIICDAAKRAFEKGDLSVDQIPDMDIEVPRHPSHGDFSTNFAMISASVQKMAPRKIAEALVASMVPSNAVEKVEIAGPGFVNFFLSKQAWYPVIDDVFSADDKFGVSTMGENRKIQVEFVSANPTGPLHVGHGRGAAIGDSVANILSFAGFDVKREYYINDSGRQIRTLGLSVWLRLKENAGEAIEFPDDCYKGDYIRDLARDVLENEGDTLLSQPQEKGVEICSRFAAGRILDGIKKDLEQFGVSFDHWFSEQSLYDNGKVQSIIKECQSKGLVFEEDGALWFKTEDFGDEKNRVVVRQNGLTTYFASDIAYHMDKFERGFERVIDVWGADHHGYIKRIEACLEACGKNKDQFEVILVQLVNLLRNGKPAQMSTRAGQFVTLKDIVDEVGKDAARFMFLSRSYDSGLDFDLELAKQKSSDNPVYYVQYVHARIAGILLKAVEEKRVTDAEFTCGKHLELLTQDEEINLIKLMAGFREQVEKCAATLHPNGIFTYLMGLAGAFHAYYNKHKVITENENLTLARLSLVLAVKKVIRNGLALLGVSAPERM